MKRGNKLLFGSILLCVILSGCIEKGNIPSVPEETSASAVDWCSKGFKISGDVEDGPQLWIADPVLWDDEEIVIDSDTEERADRTGLKDPHVCGNLLYRVATVRPKDTPVDWDLTKTRWVLESYDSSTGERAQKQFTRRDLGLSDEDPGVLLEMDVVAPGSFVFLYIEYEQTEEGCHKTSHKIIYTDLEGQAVQTDLWQSFLEIGIEKDTYEEEVYEFFGDSCVCDGAGNIYHTVNGSGSKPGGLYVFDRTGKLLLEEQGYISYFSFRTEDGKRIYRIFDLEKKQYAFYLADTESGEMKQIEEGVLKRDDILEFYGMSGKDIYYGTRGGKIVKWDVSSGVQTAIFSFQDNGLFRQNNGLILAEGEKPMLVYQTSSMPRKQYVMRLSEEPLPEERKVLVADLIGAPAYSTSWIADVSVKATERMPGKIFTCETGAEDPAAYRNRVLAQLIAGEGPDLLYVTETDLLMLAEKGVLADLEDLLGTDFFEDFLPGARDLGTVGGKLVGIPGSVYADGLAIPRNLWSRDTWSFEEMLALMENGKLKPLIGMHNAPMYYASFATQNAFLRYLVADSFLIDWEKRECHFEDERFLRFLRVTHAADKGEEQREKQKLLGEGDSMVEVNLSVNEHLGGNSRSASFGAQLDRENGYIIGYPTGSGSKSFLRCDRYVVVNAKSEKKEAIRVFLETLTEGDSVHAGLGRLPVEELVTDTDGTVKYYDTEIHLFDDGTTSYHRANVFLENCVASPRLDEDLWSILWEELNLLYEGAHTPEETADFLDKRIQLYLNEME